MTKKSDEISHVESDERSRQLETEAAKVPIDAFISYLSRMAPHNSCEFCDTGKYGVVPGPSGGTAGLVATPVPHVQHLGVWFFIATCTTCGHTAFFSAPFVLKAMSEER